MINPVVAKPYCCMPAVLESILRHYGYERFSQFDIAEYFGVYVPSGAILPEITNAIESSNAELFGIRFENKKLGDFFRENSITLKEEYLSVSHFFDEYHFQQKVEKLLALGCSLICGYNYSALFGTSNDVIGHVSIILSLHGTTVKMLDPGPKNPGEKNVDIEKLFFSMRSKFGGIWIIRP